MKLRIYKTGKMKNGDKLVFYGSPGEWFVFSKKINTFVLKKR